METAKHFYRLKTKFTWSDKNLVENSGSQYSKRHISRLIALNKLPEKVRKLVHTKEEGNYLVYKGKYKLKNRFIKTEKQRLKIQSMKFQSSNLVQIILF